MTPRIQRRPATDQDSEFAYRVKRAALGEYVAATWGWDEEWQVDYHERDFDPAAMEIIQWDGEDIGTLVVSEQEDQVSLNEIYILPRFQRQGIGTALIREVMARSRDLALWVFPMAWNERASRSLASFCRPAL